MPRARDLDTIAPDDPIISSPLPSRPVKKSKKHHPRPSTSSSHSADLKFRQKVYELIRGKTGHSLSAFLALPRVFNFDTRDDNEEIILVLRRHWFTNLRWILVALAMIIFPVFFGVIPLLDFFTLRYQFVFILFWYLITFAVAFENFLSWYFNVFIITEERVIDIDFYNLLSKKFSEAKISMIQDVTATQKGVSQTILNYGTVLIQTASEIPVIKIETIPNPNLVIQVLQQMRGEEEQEAVEGRIR